MTSCRTGFNTMFRTIVLTLIAVSGCKAGPTTPVVFTYYANKLLSWFKAAQFCHDQNGSLATIPNDMAASALQQRLEVRAFIGLHKSAAGFFMWLPDCLPLGDYQPWYWGEENPDDCVLLQTLGKVAWTGRNCDYSNNFICETTGDECGFIEYKNKKPTVMPHELQENSSETLCKARCRSFSNNSLECIGYAYIDNYCHIYAGANLTVELPMVEASETTTLVKTCYTVQINTDVISDVIVPTVTKCADAFTSSTVSETSQVETDVISTTSTTLDEVSVSLMTTAEVTLESSSQYDISMITESTWIVMETESTATSAPQTLDEISVSLMTTAEVTLESSSQYDISMTTESTWIVIETESTATSAPQTDVSSITTRFVVDVLMTTAETSAQTDVHVSMTTEYASKTFKTDNTAISVELSNISSTFVNDWMTTTGNYLKPSEQEHDSVIRESPRVVNETVTTGDVISISATSVVNHLMTTAETKMESSPLADVFLATESTSNTMETVNAAISAPSTEHVVTSAVDDVMTTASNILGSSAEDGVTMATTQSVTTPNNFGSRLVTYSCLCRCRLSANTSMRTEEITKALMVKKTSLSSFRRSKESAKDERPSAQAVGHVGVALLIVAGVAILLFDADVLIEFGNVVFNRLKAYC